MKLIKRILLDSAVQGVLIAIAFILLATGLILSGEELRCGGFEEQEKKICVENMREKERLAYERNQKEDSGSSYMSPANPISPLNPVSPSNLLWRY